MEGARIARRTAFGLAQVAQLISKRTYHCDHTLFRDMDLLRIHRAATMRAVRMYTAEEEAEPIWFCAHHHLLVAKAALKSCPHDVECELEYVDAMVRFTLERMVAPEAYTPPSETSVERAAMLFDLLSATE
jgi:hypothetical protein